ncbi:MAG: histone deacetylase family protein [Aestuariivita sp.]|nr:histone deacetylase family protein [Aestuariivita sp.]
MKTAVISHRDCHNHFVPLGHPECVDRLKYIEKALGSLDVTRMNAPLATKEFLLLAHPEDYILELQTCEPKQGHHNIDSDTCMGPGTLNAAFRSAGANLLAVDSVLTGELGNAFISTRPPGHHAEHKTAMGFCFFGNAALAAKHALENHGLDRVAIIDFDVHHGNGTQALLWDEPRTLFISSQQIPLWPGSGHPSETGASGNIVNISLPPLSDGAFMRNAYEVQAFPRLRDFQPQLMIISAGFDAHKSDPLANLNWNTEDYRWLTENLCTLSHELCDGRIISTLEGGYDLNALSESVKVHVEELRKASQ